MHKLKKVIVPKTIFILIPHEQLQEIIIETWHPKTTFIDTSIIVIKQNRIQSSAIEIRFL